MERDTRVIAIQEENNSRLPVPCIFSSRNKAQRYSRDVSCPLDSRR